MKKIPLNPAVLAPCKPRVILPNTQKTRVPKQYLWGTIATNNPPPFSRGTSLPKQYPQGFGVLFWCPWHRDIVKTVPLCQRGTEIVPLRVPNYGQPNSAPRGTVSVPFFLSEWQRASKGLVRITFNHDFRHCRVCADPTQLDEG